MTDAHAVAFRLPNQDPEAIARGNAFAATADNPSAIYYNPAGITQLDGHHFTLGLYLVSAGTEFESSSGLKARTDTTFQPVPQLYYVYSPEESRFSYGLGVYAPYGLSLDWGDNNPFRTLAQNGQIVYATINPVVAYQVHRTLSIAIGPTINYSKAELERGIGVFPGDQFRFKGDGIDYGFNAGLFWHPHEKWAFGLNYRYATEIKYKGDSEASPFFPPTSSSGSVRFPQFAVAGVSFRPTENWNLEVNIDWTDWDNVNEIVFRDTSFGDIPFPLNYTSSFMYQFGVTRKLPNDFFVSAGYFFSENSSPEEFFNPIVPDSDLHLGSFGFGRRGERWNWAFAYHFGYNPGRDINNGTLADGTYKTLNHGFNLSATLKF
ncbi:MAG: outer membrane protein transport protein [Verrucomicrobia bacterium]|nr:outer membrane protein transport protein [Verrucomicrobiota bacterium]